MSEIIIKKLEFPDTVRNNVGMYLGTTEDFTTPVREIINNSTDELINGYAKWIKIVNNATHKVVIDDGRGLPIYVDEENPDKVIAHATINSLHAGSKMDDGDIEVTAGVHGVGSSAVNAVSESYILAVRVKMANIDTTLDWVRDQANEILKLNKIPVLVIEYRQGLFHEEKVITVDQLSNQIEYDVPDDFSTLVRIIPDTEIYNSTAAKISLLPLQVTLADYKGSSIEINDEQLEPFSFDRQVAKGSPLFLDTKIPFEFKFNKHLTIKGIIGYDNQDMSYNSVSMVNLIETTQGGYLERRIATCFGMAFADLNSVLTTPDAKYGLIVFSNAFTSLKLSFASQTKEKLVRLGVSSIDRQLDKLRKEGVPEEKLESELIKYALRDNEFEKSLTNYFRKVIKDNPKYFDTIAKKIIEYKKQLNKLSNTDFIKSQLVMGDESDRRRAGGVAAKIYEATSRDFEKRELYITEGLSASGGIISERNSQLQSVLPLRGKIRNSTDMDEMDIVNSPELLAMINTIGCGIGSLADVSKSRYGKIIIATDSDPDGCHISNLILAVFLTHCPDLVKAGLVYKLTPPFYAVEHKGKMTYYQMDERDKIDFNKGEVHKRKGLGSYSKSEVEKFMINPKSRCLTQIVLNDDLDSNIFKDTFALMYSSAARKRLMVERGVLPEEIA